MAFDGNFIEVRAQRTTLWGNGYRPVAIYSPGAIDAKGKPIKGAGKRPVGNDWRGRALRNPPADIGREAKRGETNTGIVLGEMIALDVDVLMQEITDAIVAKIETTLGWTPLSRIGRAPKIVLCYRAEERFGKLATKKYRLPDGSEAQLEILADGQQIVAYGEHPDTLRPFEWPCRSPLDTAIGELPTISSMQARDLIGEADAILKAAGGVAIKPETKSGERKKPETKPHTRKGSTEPGDFFRAVNDAALDDIALWAPILGFHDRGNSGWRLSSQELSRPLEEDISIHSDGIRDFGEEKTLTAIDVVIKLAGAADAAQAAHWLCDRLGKDPVSFGWRSNPTPETAPPPEFDDNAPPEPLFDEPLSPSVASISAADAWSEPDLNVLRQYRRDPPSLPIEVFGSAWSKWVKSAAKAAACPVDYVALPLMTSVSALIGHARWAQANPGWAEPPHVWGCGIGESGDGKSPGNDCLQRDVLPVIERRMVVDFPDQLREWQAASAFAKAAKERWETEVKDAEKRQAPPPLPPEDTLPPEPLAPRLRQHDVTIERVQTLLALAAPKGLLIVRDELAGWISGMTVYNESGRQFWLEAYGGRPYSAERQHKEPLIIPRLAVAVYGGIQPDRLAELMKTPDDGLLARILWAWPDPLSFRLGTVTPDAGWAVNALDRLRELDLQPGNPPQPILVPLTAEGRRSIEQFGRDMQERRSGVGGLTRSAYGKARGLALRLALGLEYLWWCGKDGFASPPDQISTEAFDAAAQLVGGYFMPMAERAYGDAATAPTDRNADTLARWIVKERPAEVYVRKVQREVRLPGFKDADAIHAAAQVLVEAGWLIPPLPGGRRQRAREAYVIKPRLWELI